MKNKKLVIVVLMLVVLIAMGIIIIKPFYDSKKFDDIGEQELLEYLKNIKNIPEKQNKIEEAIEKDWITQKQANEII
ncbi:MAG: hypothetical protein ACLS95_03200 [Clostridia bacterium]